MNNNNKNTGTQAGKIIAHLQKLGKNVTFLTCLGQCVKNVWNKAVEFKKIIRWIFFIFIILSFKLISIYLWKPENKFFNFS